VATLPFLLGAAGANAALVLSRRGVAARTVAVGGAGLQAIALAALATVEAAGLSGVPGVVALACLHTLGAQAAAAAWAPWLGALVPPRGRARWFGVRQSLAHSASLAALLAAGGWLHGLGGSFVGLYAAAAALRLGSAVLLATHAERRRPRAVGGATASGAVVRDGALMLLAVFLAAPHFVPHMLGTLQFSWWTLGAVTAVGVVGRVLAAPVWASLHERWGAQAWPVAAAVIAAVPLCWLWVEAPAGAALMEGVAGVGWAGWEVCWFATLLQGTSPRARSELFARWTVAAGLAQVSGGLLGAAVLGASGGAFAPLLLLSALSRGAATAWLARRVRAGG
jgi:hypothetical protein